MITIINLLDDDATLPQKVCDICVSIVENFIFFCNHIEKFQNKLYEASVIKKDQKETSCSPRRENTKNLAFEAGKEEVKDQGFEDYDDRYTPSTNTASEEMDIDFTCNDSLLIQVNTPVRNHLF